MEAETRQQILDKLAKIKAKEESVRELGNEAEAELFAKKLRELLHKYEMSMSDIEFDKMRETEPIEMTYVDWTDWGWKRNTARRCPVRENLACIVTHQFGCDTLVSSYSNRVWIVGRKSNRQLAEYVLGTLAITCEKLSWNDYGKVWRQAKKEGRTMDAAGYRRSFQMGFVFRIGERYKEMKAAEEAAKANTTALVRIGTELVDVRKHLSKMNTKQANRLDTMGGISWNGLGNQRGRAAADKVDITGKAIDKTAPVRTAIG